MALGFRWNPKADGYSKLVSDWSDHQVAAASAILTAEPAPNGRPH